MDGPGAGKVGLNGYRNTNNKQDNKQETCTQKTNTNHKQTQPHRTQQNSNPKKKRYPMAVAEERKRESPSSIQRIDRLFLSREESLSSSYRKNRETPPSGEKGVSPLLWTDQRDSSSLEGKKETLISIESRELLVLQRRGSLSFFWKADRVFSPLERRESLFFYGQNREIHLLQRGTERLPFLQSVERLLFSEEESLSSFFRIKRILCFKEKGVYLLSRKNRETPPQRGREETLPSIQNRGAPSL